MQTNWLTRRKKRIVHAVIVPKLKKEPTDNSVARRKITHHRKCVRRQKPAFLGRIQIAGREVRIHAPSLQLSSNSRCCCQAPTAESILCIINHCDVAHTQVQAHSLAMHTKRPSCSVQSPPHHHAFMERIVLQANANAVRSSCSSACNTNADGKIVIFPRAGYVIFACLAE